MAVHHGGKVGKAGKTLASKSSSQLTFLLHAHLVWMGVHTYNVIITRMVVKKCQRILKNLIFKLKSS